MSCGNHMDETVFNYSEIPEAIRELSGAILLAVRGSLAHGTFVSHRSEELATGQRGTLCSDDIDLIGVFIYPLDRYFGIPNEKEYPRTVEIKDGIWDYVGYELTHFVSLLLRNNPNVMNLLFQENFLHQEPEIRSIIKMRHWFVSMRYYHACEGYVHAQLNRLQKPPTEQSYEGSKRRQLYQEIGYDAKMAAHCLRLLVTGEEFLRTQHITVDRSAIDAHKYIEIKQGLWTRKDVIVEIGKAQIAFEKAAETTTLPDEPKISGVGMLLENILAMRFFGDAIMQRFGFK